MTEQRFSFKSVEKLKSVKLIGEIFKTGKSFSHFPFRIIYIYPAESKSYLQAAVSVSTKNFKKAVDRNRIKRLMREAYRLQKIPLQKNLEQYQKYLAVFIIYTGNALPTYEIVLDKMGGLLARLEKIVSNRDDQK